MWRVRVARLPVDARLEHLSIRFIEVDVMAIAKIGSEQQRLDAERARDTGEGERRVDEQSRRLTEERRVVDENGPRRG